MSKGQKRSNREPKKPKQTKPKIVSSTAASSIPQSQPDTFARGKKRW
jgi:hypothetical protein